MPLDPSVLKNWPFKRIEQQYSEDDAIRYALSVGAGDDPMDERRLPLVVQGGSGTLATMATILAPAGPWTSDPRTGVTRSKLVHGEQSVRLYRPLPRAATVSSLARVVAVVDRGHDRGAIIFVERDLRLVGTNELLAELRSASFCRADGGFGGTDVAPWSQPSMPNRKPNNCIEVRTARSAALFYQLNGDRNPLHTDPAFARKAGFERPILHGLCTFGIAGQILMGVCGNQAAEAIGEIGARFSAPVIPGDTLRVEAWSEDGVTLFTVRSVERDVKVIDGGCVRLGLAKEAKS